jgi:putative ABC transport system ATP-binding protein
MKEGPMAIIELHHVHKIYDHSAVPVHALTDVTLDIQPGEFTAVVGPSGSGKTTLLNLIGGLDAPSQGSVRLDGIDISSLNRGKMVDFRLQHIGFVFQAYNLIPVLTAEENIEFIMLLQGRTKEERRRVVGELLASVGLTDKRTSRISELSGGQQQRVAVARALASRPSFVLADEPTANLDSESAVTLLQIMEQLNHERNMTFVFSTHDIRVVQRAHRVIRLVDGRVTEDIQQPHPPR